MTVQSIAHNHMGAAMARLATGTRINSAADDAAGLAISEGLEAQIRGLNQGIDNTRDMQNLLQTADGALSNVGEGLLRIRELALQASNATLTQADRDLIQAEITQITDHIASAAQRTEFNTIPLLDGSFNNAHAATNADGSGMQITIADLADAAQAVTDFNATAGFFDMTALDEVMADTVGERANIGAVSNRLDATVEAGGVTAENLLAAQSRIADADMAQEAANHHQEVVLTQMQILMQRQEQEQVQVQDEQLLTPASTV